MIDYHVCITRSIYHYAYARQTQVNFFLEKRNKEQIRRERKGKKEQKAKKENKKGKERKRKDEKSKKRQDKKRKQGKEKRKKCHTSRPNGTD